MFPTNWTHPLISDPYMRVSIRATFFIGDQNSEMLLFSQIYPLTTLMKSLA